MTKTVSVRLDEDADRALTVLQYGGRGRSEVIREALIESAQRLRSPESLRAEAQRLMADPEYRREVKEVRELMEDLNDPW